MHGIVALNTDFYRNWAVVKLNWFSLFLQPLEINLSSSLSEGDKQSKVLDRIVVLSYTERAEEAEKLCLL